MLKEYSEETIEKISKYFFEELSKYEGEEPILFDDIDSNLLNKILFKFEDQYYSFKHDLYLYKKIDFSNVSFDNVYVIGLNFTGFRGVKIDPQTVFNKDLRYAKLCNVEIIGGFDDANIRFTDFTGSTGAKINPQTVLYEDLSNTILRDAEIKGSFNGVNIKGTDFTGSKGAKIDPQTLYNKELRNAKLCDVKIKGSFNGVDVRDIDFTGSTGAKINPQKVVNKDLSGAKLCNVEITGSLDGVNIEGTNFTGSKGALVNLYTLWCDFQYTNFCDAIVLRPGLSCYLYDYVNRTTKYNESKIVEINPQEESIEKELEVMKRKIKENIKR